MAVWTVVAMILMGVFIASLIVASQKDKWSALKFVSLAAVFAIGLLFLVRGTPPKNDQADTASMTRQAFMLDIQDKLTENPNDSELWFQLGHVYLLENDFRAARTSFGYSIRLSPEPSASQLAALASALYYLSSQSMNEEVTQLLDAALLQEPYNPTALMLIANDHFVSFRYQQAIDTWVKLLHSQQRDLDRVTIINNINRAKQLLVTQQ
ncbi:tetratricopeptide repeat protein [Vibrio paucivorans]|uniref:Cytochrome c-type biogenesis protein H TPR domain-containing protein n=1 Tax=Vibrio paucivorans TaxID=2829489 RepID=A0A9X3HRX3_9VIBR|nr:hypothetical protein [Vibrio paucivorans]MCW8334284.1 hypothetical protein [Vibrio paucivorans]